jgi:hypothetical protein
VLFASTAPAASTGSSLWLHALPRAAILGALPKDVVISAGVVPGMIG